MRTIYTYATPRVCEVEESHETREVCTNLSFPDREEVYVSRIRHSVQSTPQIRGIPETGDRRRVRFDRGRLTRDTSLSISLSFSRHVIKRQVSHAALVDAASWSNFVPPPFSFRCTLWVLDAATDLSLLWTVDRNRLSKSKVARPPPRPPPLPPPPPVESSRAVARSRPRG